MRRVKFKYFGRVWSAPRDVFDRIKVLADAGECFDLSNEPVRELRERPAPRHFHLKANA